MGDNPMLHLSLELTKLVADNLLKLRENLDEIGLHARAVIVDLHSDGKLDAGAFSSEIIRVLEEFSRASTIKIEMGDFNLNEQVQLNKNQTEHILKIVRETCNNINKHSSALLFRFELSLTIDDFKMQFIEGPIQSNPLPFKQGKGLESMIMRAKELGGEYTQFYQNKFLYTTLNLPLTEN